MDNSTLERGSGRLGAIAGLQFAKDAFDMKFCCVFREPQQFPDFLVAQSFAQEPQDLCFTGSQI